MNVWHHVEFGWEDSEFWMAVDGVWASPEPFTGMRYFKCYPEISEVFCGQTNSSILVV